MASDEVFADCTHIYDNEISDITNIQTNITHYLRNMKIDNKNMILAKSFETTKCNYFESVYGDIKIALGTLSKEILGDLSQDKWEECTGDCLTIITKYVNQEIESTAYMMRLLAASAIGDGWKRQQLEFVFDDSKMTGIWANDKTLVKLQVTPSASSSSSPVRLIMGFGPSASGKTYCAGEVIKLMQNVEKEFPDLFLSIDGGIYRECSVMYQLILNALKETTNLKGLKNLVYAGFHISDSIFDSGIIKKNVMKYLNVQKETGLHFSLYVPETLGKCMSLRKLAGFDTTCRSIYKEYIDYTDDNDWIGLMIWQHKTGEDCDKDDAHKCKGCKESGTSRELSEGKKYSSSAWQNSYDYGRIAAQSAPHYRFIIHNTGGRKHKGVDGKDMHNIITFDDYSEIDLDVQQKIQGYIKSAGWEYVQNVHIPIESVETIETKLKLARELLIKIDNEIATNEAESKAIADKESKKAAEKAAKDAKKAAEKAAKNRLKELIGGSPDDDLLEKIFKTYKLDAKMQNDLRIFYKEEKTGDPSIRFDREITALPTFRTLIDRYIAKYETKSNQYKLLEISFGILAGLQKPIEIDPTKKLLEISFNILKGLHTTKPVEPDPTKKLLTMGFDILAKLNQKQWSFKIPEFPEFPDILPEPSVRQSDIITTIDDVTSDNNTTRNIIDNITTNYNEETNPYKPAYYEHALQENENAEELKEGLQDLAKKVNAKEKEVSGIIK